MQIRVANRQDEAAIRAIVNQIKAARGETEADLQGADSDLNNVEAKYFWNDGIFVVAEENGEIVGLAGARRGEDDQTLELVRLAVIPGNRFPGVATKLLDTVYFFARNAEYRRVVFYPSKQGVVENQPHARFLKDDTDGQRMYIDIPSWRELQQM